MNVTAEQLALIRQQDYLKASEAAILTRKSKKTIYDAIYAGELEYIQHGERYYITRKDLDAWMMRLAGRDVGDLSNRSPMVDPRVVRSEPFSLRHGRSSTR